MLYLKEVDMSDYGALDMYVYWQVINLTFVLLIISPILPLTSTISGAKLDNHMDFTSHILMISKIELPSKYNL